MKLGRLGPLVDEVDRRLRDPVQLRFALCGVMFAAWYGLAFVPLGGEIAVVEQATGRAETQLETAKEIETLRAEAEKFEARVPVGNAPNEWVEYLLGGVRRFPVRLIKLEPQAPRKHGPFNLVGLKVELHGKFSDLHALIGWIEASERLLRIDAIDFEAGGNPGDLRLQIVVLGVMG